MNPKSIKLTINDKEVIVSKLPLRRIAEVFKALNDLPSKISGINFDQLSNDQFLKLLPSIIGDILPEVAKIIAVGSNLTQEQVLDECGLADTVEIIGAIFEVNEIERVVDNIKKLMARKPQAIDSKKKTGFTEPLTS